MAPCAQQDFWLALAQTHRGLAELLRQPVLSGDSRRAVLTALLALEDEIEAWSVPSVDEPTGTPPASA